MAPTRLTRRLRNIGLVTVLLASAGSAAAGLASALAGASMPGTPPSANAQGWVSDSIHSLDVFNPDADSIYLINGYGTAADARTVVSGRVPDARYWSFTAYPMPAGPKVLHVHDTGIATSGGRYTVTIAGSCAGVKGTCLATTTAGTQGTLVLRLYAPVDINGAGTGGVPLPTIAYRSASGAALTLTQATGSAEIPFAMDVLGQKQGTLPATLSRPYPAAGPVATAVVDPVPQAFVSTTQGPYANPDNIYQHLTYTSTRGDLVVSARAPTYDTGPSDHAGQVRYWSLCTQFKGGYTGACLHDQQVHLAHGSDRFTVVVAPTCPVAGYANCLVAGPETLQRSLLYRNLLPSPTFTKSVFKGTYGLSARYVARPG